MKKATFIAFLLPVLIFAACLGGRLDQVAYADSGRGGHAGFAGRGGGFAGRGTGGFVGRGGGGFVGHGGHFGHRHGGGFSGDIWIGPGLGFWDPFFYPYYYPYYPYPYYAPSTTVVVPEQSREYIMQTPQPQETGYWYYCKDAKGYYPYVKRCPGGWMRVVPSSSPPDQDPLPPDEEPD